MKKVIHPCDVKMYDGKFWPLFAKISIENDRLSISGVIGPLQSGNAKGGCGQINMEFAHRNPSHNDKRYGNPTPASELRFSRGWNADTWYSFLEVWHDWHLNDMHAECEHQEAAGITYSSDPENVCSVCGYEIGSAWTTRQLPADVISFLNSLPDTDRRPNWV
jgi:hypothetical protein